jgi:hypothetical protein
LRRVLGCALAGLLLGACRIGYDALEQAVTSGGADSTAAGTTQGGQSSGIGGGSPSGGDRTAGGAASSAGASMMGDSGAAGAVDGGGAGAVDGGGAGAVDGGGTLTVTSSQIQSGTDVDLTTLGSSDWAHWGLGGPDEVNRKQGGTLLGPVSAIGNEALLWYDDSLFGFTWTNGTPTPSAAYTTTGIWLPGNGNGFRFSVLADDMLRSLTIYVGVYQGEAELHVSLEDGSAAPFIDTSTTAKGAAGVTVAYAVAYRAASPGQTLAIEWTLIAGKPTGGRMPNVTWQAATIP